MPLRAAIVAALLGLAAEASAQPDMIERETRAVVYGDDPCPQPTSEDEVVVCARRPEEERYRIPAPLRRSRRPAEAAWTSRVAEVEDAQRDSRPDSCSVVGSHGQTGCMQELLRRWRAERRARARER